MEVAELVPMSWNPTVSGSPSQARFPKIPHPASPPRAPQTVITASVAVLSEVEATLMGYAKSSPKASVGSHSPAKTTEKFWAACMSKVCEESSLPDLVTVKAKVLKLVRSPVLGAEYLNTSVVMVCCPTDAL